MDREGDGSYSKTRHDAIVHDDDVATAELDRTRWSQQPGEASHLGRLATDRLAELRRGDAEPNELGRIEVRRAALGERSDRDRYIARPDQLAHDADVERNTECARDLGSDRNTAPGHADDDRVECAAYAQRIRELPTGIGSVQERHGNSA